MHYKCPICGDTVEDDLKQFIDHTEDHVVDVIKEKHPQWVEADGLCPKCLNYYKSQMKGNSE